MQPHALSDSIASTQLEKCGVYVVAFKYAFLVEKRDNLAVFRVRQSSLEADGGYLIAELRDDLEWARSISE